MIRFFYIAKTLINQNINIFLKIFNDISKETGYPVLETSNEGIMPLDTLSNEGQKIVIFDDYLNTGEKMMTRYETISQILEIKTVPVYT